MCHVERFEDLKHRVVRLISMSVMGIWRYDEMTLDWLQTSAYKFRWLARERIFRTGHQVDAAVRKLDRLAGA